MSIYTIHSKWGDIPVDLSNEVENRAFTAIAAPSSVSFSEATYLSRNVDPNGLLGRLLFTNLASHDKLTHDDVRIVETRLDYTGILTAVDLRTRGVMTSQQVEDVAERFDSQKFVEQMRALTEKQVTTHLTQLHAAQVLRTHVVDVLVAALDPSDVVDLSIAEVLDRLNVLTKENRETLSDFLTSETFSPEDIPDLPALTGEEPNTAFGEWSVVDRSDPRLPQVEDVMRTYGLSGEYAIGFLDRGSNEGPILVVDVGDARKLGDTRATALREYARVDSALRGIDPSIRAATSLSQFEEPRVSLGADHFR